MALKTEKLKAPLFPGPVGAGTTNDWCSIRLNATLQNEGTCVCDVIKAR